MKYVAVVESKVSLGKMVSSVIIDNEDELNVTKSFIDNKGESEYLSDELVEMCGYDADEYRFLLEEILVEVGTLLQILEEQDDICLNYMMQNGASDLDLFVKSILSSQGLPDDYITVEFKKVYND